MMGQIFGYSDQDLLGDKLAIAYHEAGHAIVGIVLGRTLKSVAAYNGDGREDTYSVGVCTFAPCPVDFNDIVIGVAGICAQELVDSGAYLSEYSGDLSRIRLDYGKFKGGHVPHGEWQAKGKIDFQITLREAHRTARRILCEKRQQLDSLAEAILNGDQAAIEAVVAELQDVNPK